MQTKQRIYDCAVELFSENGFDAVSMREISKTAGIQESSIYRHYAGKKKIMDSICDEFLQVLRAARPPLEDLEQMLGHLKPREIFKMLVLSYGIYLKQHTKDLTKIIFSEQYHNKTVQQIFKDEIIEKNVEYYESLFKLMVRQEKIHMIDTHAAAILFNNQQLMLYIQWVNCESEAECIHIRQVMSTSADFLFDFLECRPNSSANAI